MKAMFVVVAFFFLLLLPSGVFACSCATGAPPFEFNRAKAVFIGRMLGGTEKLSVKGQDGKPHTIEAGQVRFAVEEVFKGDVAGQVTLGVASMDGTSCGPYGLTRGETYVVYAYAYDNVAGLHTGVCTRTMPAKSQYAKADLDFLRNLPPPGVGGNIRGRIWADLRAGGATPLADVKVNVVGPDGQALTAFTDKDGVFEVRQLKPGKYRVEPEFPLHYTTGDESEEVVVEDRGTAAVGFEAYVEGEVSGRMIDAEGRGFNSVFLHLEGGGKRVYGHSTREDGGFLVEGVPPGEYLLFVEMQGADYKQNKNYYYPGTFRKEEATTVRVGLGEKVEGLEFRLPEGLKVVAVEGQIVWKDGRPAAEVEVMLLCPQGAGPDGLAVEFSPPTTRTDQQGRFRLEGFTAQTYWLEARGSAEGDKKGEHVEMHSRPRKLSPSAETKDLKLVLSEKGSHGGCEK
jgi:hypothetical protein